MTTARVSSAAELMDALASADDIEVLQPFHPGHGRAA